MRVREQRPEIAALLCAAITQRIPLIAMHPHFLQQYSVLGSYMLMNYKSLILINYLKKGIYRWKMIPCVWLSIKGHPSCAPHHVTINLLSTLRIEPSAGGNCQRSA